MTTSRSLESDPTQAQAVTPIDQVRHQVAVALFGPSEPVAQVGRFHIQRLLGTGGMGVVYAADDPQLGRTVALKLLQPLTAGERARERLLREAQAMARLQHPNVVGVYEAGVYGEQVYLVMEYVEDGTLADWLRVRARSWQEIVGVLAQAGDGLAAAHAAGLVHRDFKPTNILMGAGRARISDFGLARTASTAEDLERTGDGSDSGLLLASPLTRTGALLGTPAYMAPEQIRGESATPASDQFAFGVVLHEALVGHRPFQGGSVGALLKAIDAGKISASTRRLPKALMAVVRRALQPDPARRYPDMPSLLTALRSVRGGDVRAVAAAASLAGVLGGFLVATSEPSVGACEVDALGDAWNIERHDEVDRTLADPGVGAALDAYAQDWQRAYTRRCEADAQGVQWTDTCLEDRRLALADLVAAIVAAPEHVRPAARLAVDMLPALADCAAAPKYTALVSGAAPEVRAAVWRGRLGLAPAFAPRAAARPLELPHVAFAQQDFERTRQDMRAVHEASFASVVQGLHPSANSDDPLLAPRDQLARLLHLAGVTAEAGYADLAARSFVLAAELLETRAHADGQREQVWAQAEQSLALLPATHPLRVTLQRDLAYLRLTHARHATAAGACAGADADFAACDALFSATRSLAAIAASEAATPGDRELLARAHEHAGDAAAAATARASAGPLKLDERALGYLDFSAGVTVPDGPLAADSIRCDLEATACEIDRAFAEALRRDPAALFGDAHHMASVKDGQYRGHKLYGISQGSTISLLGYKNGDLFTAIDGVAVSEDNFMPRISALLQRGEGTLVFERKGATMTRKLTIR